MTESHAVEISLSPAFMKGTNLMETKSPICGKTFTVEDPEMLENPELLCRLCSETSCKAYLEFLYDITHHNNPM
jgi:hypothetical protein